MYSTPSPWRELFALCFKRPLPSEAMAARRPEGNCYGVAHGPVITILVPVVVVGLLADVPLALVIVALCHPVHAWPVHVIVAVLGLSTLGWAIAKRRIASAMPHVLGADTFWLGGGMAYAGGVPLRAVRSAEVLQGSRYAWAASRSVRMSDVMVGSRLDPPNVAIEIDSNPAQDIRLVRHGRTIETRRWLLIYADKPAELADGIDMACRRSTQAVSADA